MPKHKIYATELSDEINKLKIHEINAGLNEAKQTHFNDCPKVIFSH